MEQGKLSGRANALTREFVVEVVVTTSASPDTVYDVLSDLRTHEVWAGEQQSKRTRIARLDAPTGIASVGTEFTSEGIDPMGRFTDRSVVTEASRPRLFEFVTEARLETKKGEAVDWTNVHRYRITATPAGCRIEYTVTVARISALPGALAMLRVPVLSWVAKRASASMAKRGVRNLARLAEQRVRATGQEGDAR